MRRINLRMEDSLFKLYESNAKEKNVSLNKEIVKVLEKNSKTLEIFAEEHKKEDQFDTMINLLENQNKLLNELNQRHEIHANLLKDLLLIE